MRFVITALCLCYTILIEAQIVAIEPSVFGMSDFITITYDATKGSGALEGVDQVFAHTGVITVEAGPGSWQNVQGNWGQFDPKVLMTNIGNNLHQISFVPDDFYGLSGNETVVQLAFVFRNEDGSREGKTSSLGDIFVDVPNPDVFGINFLSPDEQHFILDLNENLTIKAVSTRVAELKMFDNNTLIQSTYGNEIEFDFLATITGNHLIVVEADDGLEKIQKQISFVVLNDQLDRKDSPFPLKQGLNRIKENQVFFNLHAPNKENVFIIGSFTDWIIDENFQMTNSTNGNEWWIELDQLNSDQPYGYQYVVDGEIIIADPYSELILDPQNDKGIPLELNSIPMDYPNGKTSGHVSVFKTIKDDFQWLNTDFERPADTDLVVYEIMMRDFLEDHSFKSLTDTLSYIKRLGINAIELMPVSEFENNESWGYNVSYHMALDKYFGSPESLKKLVDTAHGMGIAVLLDVVYNHAFGQSPLVRLFWDRATGKPVEGGPYFNPDARHIYNVGFDFNHESYATKTYVKQTLKYWVQEFNIDGFRFDLSKGFTQRAGFNDATFAAYDQSRINILSDYGNYLRQFDDELILILEHFSDLPEFRVLSNMGFLLWGNANHNFNEATMGYHDSDNSNFQWIYHENIGFTEPHLLTYMESHDEERLMYKNKTYGNSDGGYDVKNLSTGLDRVEAAACFLFSVPGPKMLFQFGELGYGYSINTCENGSVNDNCRLSPKPIRWDYYLDSERRDLYDVFQKMIDLKVNYPAIKDGDVQIEVKNAVKRMKLFHPEGDLIVIANFDVEPQIVVPGFTHSGDWFDYLDNSKFVVSDPNISWTFAPGEYHVYLDDKSFVTSTKNEVMERDQYVIFPNPTKGEVNVHSTRLGTNEMLISLLDIEGKSIESRKEKLPMKLNIAGLQNGVYILRVTDEKGNQISQRLVKL